MLDDKFLEVCKDNDITDDLGEIRRCIAEKNIEGFDEIIPRFIYRIQELTLEINKKIVIPKIV